MRWCGRGDLNPHAFRRHPLKMVCLPVPPLPQAFTFNAAKTCKILCEASLTARDLAAIFWHFTRVSGCRSWPSRKQRTYRILAVVHTASSFLCLSYVIVPSYLLQCERFDVFAALRQNLSGVSEC